MATIVHTTGAERLEADRSETGAGWMVAIIALIAIVLLFLLAGAYFNGGSGTNVNLPSTPDTTSGNVSGAGTYEIPSSGALP